MKENLPGVCLDATEILTLKKIHLCIKTLIGYLKIVTVVCYLPLAVFLLRWGKIMFLCIWDTKRKQASRKLNIDEWSVALGSVCCWFAVNST